MAAAPDVASLVSRAQQLSSTPQGLDALHTALEQSADLLKANAAEALAALEARALDPKRHALAWTHFLRAAVASTRPEKKLGERSRGDGPGASLPSGTLSAPAERGVAGDDDDADATAEANEEGEPVLPETCTPETATTPLTTSLVTTRDAMDTPPGGRTPRAFGFGNATDDEEIIRGDDHPAGDDAYYDAVVDRIAEEASGVDDTKHTRSLAASFPAFRVLASELLLRSSDESESVETETTVSTPYETERSYVAASAQVRRCFSAFAEVSRSFAHGALAENTAVSALAAVAPLRAATRAARPTRDHLTKQHAFLFAACVACGRHDVVADDLDRFPVFETDPGVTGVDAMDYQKYCELGGTALVSLGRYADAAELFLRLACAPAARATPAHAARAQEVRFVFAHRGRRVRVRVVAAQVRLARGAAARARCVRGVRVAGGGVRLRPRAENARAVRRVGGDFRARRARDGASRRDGASFARAALDEEADRDAHLLVFGRYRIHRRARRRRSRGGAGRARDDRGGGDDRANRRRRALGDVPGRRRRPLRGGGGSRRARRRRRRGARARRARATQGRRAARVQGVRRRDRGPRRAGPAGGREGEAG